MAYSATINRSIPTTAGDRSRTITIHDSQPREEEPEGSGSSSGAGGSVGTLKLRGGPRKKSQRKVVWDENVVDNEGCGRKSSKICCIYHRPKQFDESSDEDSTDTDSDSDYGCDHDHHHRHDDPHGSPDSQDGGGGGTLQGASSENSAFTTIEEHSEPNAYEKIPFSHKGKKRAS